MSMINYFVQPREIDPAGVPWGCLQTLLFGAIVNPLGPTFFGVASMESGDQNELLVFSINPFAQSIRAVATHQSSIEKSDYVRLHPLFEGFGCPTFFCASSNLSESERVEVLEEWFRTFGGAADMAERVMRHLGDPWNRVAEMVEGTYRSTRQKKRLFGFHRKETRADRDSIPSFIQASVTVKHLKPEIYAFFYAWSGAIEHTTPSLAKDALRVERAIDLFVAFSAGCSLPSAIWEGWEE